MRIHHLNCGTIQGLSVCGEHLICHCLLIETPAHGLVLVDTGLGAQDFAKPEVRLGKMFAYGYARPKNDPSQAAIAQVKKLGFDPKDVRNIVMTHLDLDHVGGLVDFPHAKVHTHATEYGFATTRPDLLSRKRYAPKMFEHGPDFRTYTENGEKWFGFDSVRGLEGLPPEILLIPTFGHTRGHTAVAIQKESGWMLHAGDAYFDHREVTEPTRVCSPLLRTFQFFNETNRKQRLGNQDRLRALVGGNKDVQVFSAHNPFELKDAIQASSTQIVK